MAKTRNNIFDTPPTVLRSEPSRDDIAAQMVAALLSKGIGPDQAVTQGLLAADSLIKRLKQTAPQQQDFNE